MPSPRLSAAYFVAIFLIFTVKSTAQISCANPVYVCDRATPNNFPSCSFNVTMPAVVNDLPCVKGAPSTTFGCGMVEARNQTWLMVQVEETDGSPMSISITNSNNVTIGASVTLPINNQQDICRFLIAQPMDCQFRTANPTL
jgi:hypothetical protein